MTAWKITLSSIGGFSRGSPHIVSKQVLFNRRLISSLDITTTAVKTLSTVFTVLTNKRGTLPGIKSQFILSFITNMTRPMTFWCSENLIFMAAQGKKKEWQHCHLLFIKGNYWKVWSGFRLYANSQVMLHQTFASRSLFEQKYKSSTEIQIFSLENEICEKSIPMYRIGHLSGKPTSGQNKAELLPKWGRRHLFAS